MIALAATAARRTRPPIRASQEGWVSSGRRQIAVITVATAAAGMALSRVASPAAATTTTAPIAAYSQPVPRMTVNSENEDSTTAMAAVIVSR